MQDMISPPPAARTRSRTNTPSKSDDGKSPAVERKSRRQSTSRRKSAGADKGARPGITVDDFLTQVSARFMELSKANMEKRKSSVYPGPALNPDPGFSDKLKEMLTAQTELGGVRKNCDKVARNPNP